MSLPSLEALNQTGVSLVICGRAWAQDLLAGIPKKDFISLSGGFLPDRAVVAAHRRAGRQPASSVRGLVLPDSLSSAAVFRLAGIPSAGYRDDGRSVLLRWAIAKPKTELHAVQSWYHLTHTALALWGLPKGGPAPEPQLKLPLTSNHQAKARQALADAGLREGSFVLISPTATGLHKGKIKVWPGFDWLVRRLQARGYTVIMCPPAAEIDQARHNAPTATLLPPLSLGPYAALTTHAALVICNDSGVSHLAAAAGARQLTLFGVTRATRTGPWSPQAVCLGSEAGWPAPEEVERITLKLLQAAQ
jgi:heptosyltransferase-2